MVLKTLPMCCADLQFLVMMNKYMFRLKGGNCGIPGHNDIHCVVYLYARVCAPVYARVMLPGCVT